MPRSHLAFFLPHLTIGGVQRVMLRLSGELARRGHRVDLVLQRAHGDLLDLVPDQVRVVDLARPRMLRTLPDVVRYLRRERPDVFLSALCQANLVAVLARRLSGVQTRIYIREAAAPEAQRRQTTEDKRLARVYRFVPYLYPWADGIIAPSQGVADELARFFRIDRRGIEVVNNPVVGSELAARAMEAVEHEWLTGPVPVILGVGRFAAQKDLPTLLRAFAMVREQHEARLILLGDGELRPRLEALVQELGIAADVSMPGFVTNPYAWMSKASVYVQTSRWEGFPNTLVEALACGVPVVATDCPSGPREILDGGRYGPLVRMGDPASVAAGVVEALDSPVDRELRIRRAAKYSVSGITDLYEALLLSDAYPVPSIVG